jgi:hypothetical protein
LHLYISIKVFAQGILILTTRRIIMETAVMPTLGELESALEEHVQSVRTYMNYLSQFSKEKREAREFRASLYTFGNVDDLLSLLEAEGQVLLRKDPEFRRFYQSFVDIRDGFLLPAPCCNKQLFFDNEAKVEEWCLAALVAYQYEKMAVAGR